jgi:hypothetical protein
MVTPTPESPLPSAAIELLEASADLRGLIHSGSLGDEQGKVIGQAINARWAAQAVLEDLSRAGPTP